MHRVRSSIDRKDRRRSEQLERGETSVTEAKETSKRFLVSSLLEDATVCPTVCTTCSTRCDRATRPSRANLPSFAYAERDCRRWPSLPDDFYDRSVWVEQTNRESFRENEFCPVLWRLWWTFLRNESSSIERIETIFFERMKIFVYFDRDDCATNQII